MQVGPVMPHMPAPAAGTGGDFGNAMPAAPGTAGTPPAATPVPRANCSGGVYLGTYNCTIDIAGIRSPLEGDVSFALEIDQAVAPGQCDAEFCPDLVIAAGSGTLFGLAGLTGFEAELDGGLDCQTGEFRASAPNGIYGIPGSIDPDDPDALWTVLDPPLGTFMGSLTGMHASGPVERITGEWDLVEPAISTRCAGPFMVELQP
jgi:hypothetical protein